MNGKTAKRVRKLQRIFGYTPMMYQTMKKIVKGFKGEQREHFSLEVDAMIDWKVPRKPPIPDVTSPV